MNAFESIKEKLLEAKKLYLLPVQEFLKKVEFQHLEEMMGCGEIMMQ